MALAFFIVRSLKVAVSSESPQKTSYYGTTQTLTGHKNFCFLLFVAGVELLLHCWLSYHLLGSTQNTPKSKTVKLQIKCTY